MHITLTTLHKIAKTCTLYFAVLFLAACTDSQIAKELRQLESGEIKPAGIKMIYPQNGTIFPVEISAPLFEWKDSLANASKWNISVTNDEGKIVLSSESKQNTWRPSSSDWEKIKKRSTSEGFSFTVVSNIQKNKRYSSCKIQFSISKDPIGADIFYRAVTLPFSYAVKNVKTIEWYLGSVNGNKPRKMLDNIPVCGNCHSFAHDKPLLAMDIDYGNDKGSYIISDIKDTCSLKPENIITWSDYKREDGEPTFGLLSQISPDGNHVLSTVKDLSVFVAVDNNLAYSQLFFPIKGIIGIYNRKSNSFDALKGADDARYVQSNPTWSPDGKQVIFAKTEAYVSEKIKKAGKALLTLNDIQEFSSGDKQFKYDLYSVNFNNGEGGTAMPLAGASNNGKSNYFPKYSPDGKWIVFCQAENFMLLQRDSRMYIMPSGGGTPRLMNCNMEEMNSWHSWSPNSRWIVFSSKNRGLYTQLYLTHIDENGMDSPPVLLENLSFEKRAANIPEFIPFNSEHFKIIKDNFSGTPQYFNRTAVDEMSNKYYKRAMDDLNKAISADSNYLESYFNMMMLNIVLKQPNSKKEIADKKKALKLVMDTLRVKPLDENFISLKITLLSNMGRWDEAMNEVKLAIEKIPNNYRFHELLSSIYRKKNQSEKAIQCYGEMMKINPRKKVLLNNLIAETYMKYNQIDEALKIVNQSLKERGDDYELIFTRAQILLEKKNAESAKKDIDFLLSKEPGNYKYNRLLAQYYMNQGNKRLYYSQMKNNLQLLQDLYNKNNEDVESIFELASVYLSVGDLQNSETWYNRILDYFPGNYEALKQKAMIKLKMQQWNDAIAVYDQLEMNYLLEEEFLNNKAIAYIQVGNYSKALDYFDKTIELNPNNKDALFNRDRLKAEMAGRR